MLPIVAIIGKPNVGKSTLFNRFVGSRKAIVSPTPGTTRDRHYHVVEGGKPFLLVDTGGIESKTEGVLEKNIVHQAKLAIEEADVILFLVDAKEELTKEDFFVADLLRKSKKKIILVATKCDRIDLELPELARIGFGMPFLTSAFHNRGIAELRTLMIKHIPRAKKEKPKTKTVNIAILGRPNVGKSSLINRLIGSEKLIASEIPGTTVDSTDVTLEHDGTSYTLIDTAGIRRRGKIGNTGIEKYSFLRSLQTVERADVCVLLIDAQEGITSQDQHIAHYILERYSGLILVLNKIDLLTKGEEDQNRLLTLLRHKFDFVPWAPVVLVSAKTGKNIEKILELSSEIKERRNQTIENSLLKRWIQNAALRHMPASTGKTHARIFRMSQEGISPPFFRITSNVPGMLHFSYLRYLENSFREDFDFVGTPIRFTY